MKTQTIKKTKTEWNLERENLGMWTGTVEASLTNIRGERENLRHWRMEEMDIGQRKC